MGSRKKKKKNRRKGNQKGPVAVSNPDRHASAPTDTPASASPTAEGSAPATPTTETAPLSDVDLQPFGEGPRFSVLMAAYNRADLIHVAIESVLVQDFQDYELVIVDDGSTDETPSVVRGYTDPRIRYIQKAENEGRAPTRRRAVAEARGEFVLWMADDDLIAEKLARVGTSKAPALTASNRRQTGAASGPASGGGAFSMCIDKILMVFWATKGRRPVSIS